MALLLHRSDRPLTLADEFAALLAHEPLDVFSPEVVVVGAPGVERWLTQRLAHTLGARHGDDGVAAGLDVRSPASLTALLLGRERDDPWQADRLVWPVLEALETCFGTPGFEAVTHHLGAGPAPQDAQQSWEHRARRSRRYAVARRLAGLFSSYARERPTLLQAWESELDEDGTGTPLAEDLRWQPVLWRATVTAVLRSGTASESPTARQERVVAELRSGGRLPDLPGRLSLFGHTRLAAADLDLLDALASRIDVHLWLPHPSPALWSTLEAQRGIVPRRDDTSEAGAVHPLLTTLGRDCRELQRAVLHHAPVDHSPPGRPGASRPDTRLTRLQADVRANVAPSSSPAIPDTDRSIQVHACHGPARQVEVLREVLLALLDESGGALQPRDVLVMCPDIETFAPLLQAAFAIGGDGGDPAGSHPGKLLRVQLADRGLSATNPLVDVAEHVLGIVTGRVATTDVFDLLALPLVRSRFGLDEDDLELLARWVGESGVRWGIDGRHRGEYGLSGLTANTWESGLDRIALGVALSGTSPAAGELLPLDDLGSQDTDAVAALLELLDLLEGAADAVRVGDGTAPGEMTAGSWVEWLRTTVLDIVEVPAADGWQVAQFERELTTALGTSGGTTPLRLTDVRVMVDQQWRARASRSNFRTGAVTVCTMVPMRSVPHKVVIALGVDDGTYPRTTIADGDDVLARRPLTGERDPRAEDSQLVLDALMAAQETFVAIYSGFDERSGQRRPPAVPLQEVVSAAARTGHRGDPAAVGALPFVHEHPLQAFDERNFDTTSFLPGGTYDHDALAGALALRTARDRPSPRPPLLARPLAPQEGTALTLDDLVAFLENPAREFLRRRLGITLPRTQDELDTGIPLALDGLEQWKIGDRLLRQVHRGVPLAAALEAERRRGSLPPGQLGEPVLTRLAAQVNSVLSGVSPTVRGSVPVALDLAGGVRLSGTVADVAPGYVETVTFSTIAPKHLAGAWVRLLALAVTHPEQRWSSVLHGKRRAVTLTAPEAGVARELLDELVEYRAKGTQFPLGIPPKAASAYTTAFEQHRRRRPDDVAGARDAGLDAAERIWSGGRFPERSEDPWWAYLYGPRSTVSDLNAYDSLVYWAPLVWMPIHTAGGRVS